jgi:hypothetical protein
VGWSCLSTIETPVPGCMYANEGTEGLSGSGLKLGLPRPRPRLLDPPRPRPRSGVVVKLGLESPRPRPDWVPRDGSEEGGWRFGRPRLDGCCIVCWSCWLVEDGDEKKQKTRSGKCGFLAMQSLIFSPSIYPSTCCFPPLEFLQGGVGFKASQNCNIWREMRRFFWCRLRWCQCCSLLGDLLLFL